MQDEYIDRVGDIWTRLGEGITWRDKYGYCSKNIYVPSEGTWWVYDTDTDDPFVSAISSSLLEAAWDALKGETQKAPCGAQVQSTVAD